MKEIIIKFFMKKANILLGILGSLIVLYSSFSLYFYKKSSVKYKHNSEKEIEKVYIICNKDQDYCIEKYNEISYFYENQYLVQLYINPSQDLNKTEFENILEIDDNGKYNCIKSSNFCQSFSNFGKEK